MQCKATSLIPSLARHQTRPSFRSSEDPPHVQLLVFLAFIPAQLQAFCPVFDMAFLVSPVAFLSCVGCVIISDLPLPKRRL